MSRKDPSLCLWQETTVAVYEVKERHMRWDAVVAPASDTPCLWVRVALRPRLIRSDIATLSSLSTLSLSSFMNYCFVYTEAALP